LTARLLQAGLLSAQYALGAAPSTVSTTTAAILPVSTLIRQSEDTIGKKVQSSYDYKRKLIPQHILIFSLKFGKLLPKTSLWVNPFLFGKLLPKTT
jgi:hypothetical protein